MRRMPQIHGRHRNKPIESWQRKPFSPFSLYGSDTGARDARLPRRPDSMRRVRGGNQFSPRSPDRGPHSLYPVRSGSISSQWQRVSKTETNPKVLLIVGSKKVGKTTLIEKLIPELTSRGYRVATVKHHHSDFPVSVDAAGTDTWRHRQAGAKSVALVTPTDVALFHDTDESLGLDQIIANFSGTDIVLVEGFHLEPYAKIAVMGETDKDWRLRVNRNLIATVGPTMPRSPVPSFEPDNIRRLADHIEKWMSESLRNFRPARRAV